MAKNAGIIGTSSYDRFINAKFISKAYPDFKIFHINSENNCINQAFPFNTIKIFERTLSFSILSYGENYGENHDIHEIVNEPRNRGELKSLLEITRSSSGSIEFICGQKLPMHMLQSSEKPYVIKLHFKENPISILSYKHFLENKLKNLYYEDFFSLKIIRFCLRHINIAFEPINDYSIQFKAPFKWNTRPSSIMIEIKNQILKISNSFNLSLHQRPEIFKSELLKQLSFINSSVKYGRFIFKPELVFITSYFITGNLKLVFNTLEEIKKINKSIQKLVNNIERSLTSKNFELTEQEFKEEKKIVSQLKSNPKSHYFINSFKRNLIQFNEIKIEVCFFQFLNSKPLQESEEKFGSKVLELISKLARISLFFKNKVFPVQDFGLLENKICYLFNRPLCCVLNYRLCTKEEAFLSKVETFENICKVIRYHECEYLTSIFKSDILNKFNDKNLFREELKDVELAKNRSILAKNNRCASTLDFYGRLISDSGIYVFYSTKVKENFLETLKRATIHEFKDLIIKVLVVIEQILLRNSTIKAFDFNCLVVCSKGRLMVIPKLEKEVEEEFWAPEVRKGRLSTKSLIYSFGVIANFICSSSEHKFCGNWKDFREIPEKVGILIPNIQEIINSCCVSNFIRRASIEFLKCALQK